MSEQGVLIVSYRKRWKSGMPRPGFQLNKIQESVYGHLYERLSFVQVFCVKCKFDINWYDM